jgi:hypothetical protein
VRRNRADVAGEDVYLSAGHHRALGRLRRAGDQLRTQHNQASRRGLAGELWLLFELARTAGRWRPRSRTYVALASLFVTAWATNADVLDDAVACIVPDVHAEGEVRLGFHGQAPLDLSWPAATPCCCVA